MAQKNFRAMAPTLIFWGFEPLLKPTFDMQILTSLNSILMQNKANTFFLFLSDTLYVDNRYHK